MTSPMTREELQRYAQLLLKGCLAFGRGDMLTIQMSVAARELGVALAEAAYAAGAKSVAVDLDDHRIYAARIAQGSRAALGHEPQWVRARHRSLATKESAFCVVLDEYELDVLAALPADRVAEHTALRLRNSPLNQARRDGRFRWTGCAWPSEEWAARVYPEVSPDKAARRLARDILFFCRLGPEDPAGHTGWTAHLATLRRRAAKLTRLDLKELHVRDRGTDLRLRIAPYSMWRGGGEKDYWGRQLALNVPTEECFISPDAAATEGTFRCSRPRSFGGRVIEDLRGEFRGGRLVRLDARRQADRDWLAKYLAAIPNAERLGEIALVDASSRIGQRGRTYYNALLDENAAAHMAFGSGFAKTRTKPLGRARYGVNRSKTHIDVMIGTNNLEATGIKQNGRTVPLVTEGVWKI
ncbi:MAG TPA: aminopeptidase [Gaiellaceae bacterium]|nr:aminopeptidase [Gaiellaceae bacterium]